MEKMSENETLSGYVLIPVLLLVLASLSRQVYVFPEIEIENNHTASSPVLIWLVAAKSLTNTSSAPPLWAEG